MTPPEEVRPAEVKPAVKKTGKKGKMNWSKFSNRFNKDNKLLSLRVVIVICLVATAVLVGWGSYYFLTTIQSKVEQAQYDSVVAKLANKIDLRVTSTITLLRVLRDAMIDNCPDGSTWPDWGMKMD